MEKRDGTAHFEQVKRKNTLVIRNILRESGSRSISEIAVTARLSYPTVSAILKELEAKQEVTLKNETKSCGGRPGICYELNSSYCYALVMYFQDSTIQKRLYDASGKIVETGENFITKDIDPDEFMLWIGEVIQQYPKVSDVVIGIPGAVMEHEITYLPKFPKLVHSSLARKIEEQFGIRVWLENDVNAIVLAESKQYQNFAHISYFNKCVGVGIVINGEVYKGCHGYAGEMENLCDDVSDTIRTFIQNILALSCVLDLPTILLSENDCDEKMISQIIMELEKRLPKERLPELVAVEELWELYEKGLLERVLIKWKKEI